METSASILGKLSPLMLCWSPGLCWLSWSPTNLEPNNQLTKYGAENWVKPAPNRGTHTFKSTIPSLTPMLIHKVWKTAYLMGFWPPKPSNAHTSLWCLPRTYLPRVHHSIASWFLWCPSWLWSVQLCRKSTPKHHSTRVLPYRLRFFPVRVVVLQFDKTFYFFCMN